MADETISTGSGVKPGHGTVGTAFRGVGGVERTVEEHAERLRVLLRDVAVVDSVAALLVEARRSMVEAAFLLYDNREMPTLNTAEAIAVLEAGVGVIDGALEKDES